MSLSLCKKTPPQLIVADYMQPLCLSLPSQAFGVQQYLDAAVESGEVVWRRGLLRKGYGLCHGVSGNGYCFLQLHRLTGRPEYLHRAAKVEQC